MKIIEVHNYDQLSKKACEIIEEQVMVKHDSVLGLATGSTPLGTYKELIAGYKEGRTDYRHVSTLNLDEYVGLGPQDPQSYRHFMNEQFFRSINVNLENTYIPNGKAVDLQDECERYEKVIEQVGPPDLQLLGIGENGHIGFNEPGTPFQSETHVVQLADSTRQANARFFQSMEDVPTMAVTMGIRSILKSKKIVLLASGERKAQAIDQLINGYLDEQFPASSLKEHSDITLIVDEDAYAEVKRKG
ncbi:glucosamine-6-phosphate deaminase [Halobacillus karajensis]|uniref:Glucosamine-6-phosphate deaminase n=1 Tax=Halobacillus karajensis TaxID=195088 RepID=A0A024P7F6_9BACI|nr:glucosamine-6-phosphate deaminase [Halobacillus karajensis]CDQ21061.1 Glucosamine-6-phosphate deaminase 1 [Halobacillus karajensis]CDQ24875.1 Glucosamine-6-phosphate deaminase 1 [Halobacillus karajensis]CDQ28765.1 Glucosamine-6-phosphate deaminase 1 [Halobacillus karajensis]SEH96737.1 glucosamine-6-phosphate deaminase [Halobacillus karajensis]